MKRASLLTLISLAMLATAFTRAAELSEPGWVSLFDGKTLDGWKASEATDSWSVADGAIVANGKPRSHLFYVGDEAPWQNFELKAEVYTEPGSNGGIYFHTEFQGTDWPRKGFETQVNVSHSDWRKTGSLYGIEDVRSSPAKDRQWWEQHIIVQGKRVIVKINGQTMVDWTEPEGATGPKRIDRGTFALQAHDPKSVVRFKNIRVKRLE